ncbi:MAG: SPOR domain-containing protein, partial [Clostridium sp.]|nr:SPOR domain-containing protein [Clostridium sp.]
GFNKYIAMGAGNNKLIGNVGLTAIWLELCDKHPKEFEQLQDAAAKRDYYLPVKTYLQKKGINLDNHDPAVRGSAFSMSIRSGALTAANKFAGCKDSDTDTSILNRIYSTYGNEDAGRWPRQLKEALDALGGTQATPEPAPHPEPEQTGAYKVQAGSYSNKKNAEKQAALIAGKGLQAIVKSERGQYKVQCGSFTSKKNATALVSSLKAAGVDAIVKGTEESVWVGKCTGNGVNVRKGPGETYGNIVGYPKLNKGNLVDVINKESGWYQILIDKKYSGFISERYISRV